MQSTSMGTPERSGAARCPRTGGSVAMALECGDNSPRRRTLPRTARPAFPARQEGASMDRKRLTLIMAVCGGLAALGSLLPWATVKSFGGSISASGVESTYGVFVLIL